MIPSGFSQISAQNQAIQPHSLAQVNRLEGPLDRSEDGSDSLRNLIVAMLGLEEAIPRLLEVELVEATWAWKLAVTEALLNKGCETLNRTMTKLINDFGGLLGALPPPLTKLAWEVQEAALQNRNKFLRRVVEEIKAAEAKVDKVVNEVSYVLSEQRKIKTEGQRNLKEATDILNQAGWFLEKAENSLKKVSQETRTATAATIKGLKARTTTVEAQTEAVKALTEAVRRRTSFLKAKDESLENLIKDLAGRSSELQSFIDAEEAEFIPK